MNEHGTSGLSGLHVAIIMDGNGRWAVARGLRRITGHRAGVEAVRRVVEAAPRLGVGTLTLYAFSANNWQRPSLEVARLLEYLREYLEKDASRLLKQGVRVSVVGRRDRLPEPLIQAIQKIEAATISGRRLHLRIAVDYSSHAAILRAARQLSAAGEISPEEFSRVLAAGVPDVDLLIRTGGEQRLSDFLLWESAYAELFFTKRMWPDFSAADLEAAIQEYHARERRFGRLPQAAAG